MPGDAFHGGRLGTAPAAGIGVGPLGGLAHRAGAWLVREIGEALRGQIWFVAIALLYLGLGLLYARIQGQDVALSLYNEYHLIFYFNFGLGFVLYRIVRLILLERPSRPLAAIVRDLGAGYLAPRRLIHALPALLLLPLVLSMSTSLKRMISVVEPFSWDARLAEIDRLLHGGLAPWELLQPLLGHPSITLALSYAYSVPWYAAILFLQFWQTFTLDPRRHQVLVTYVLCWSLLGNLAATLLSSAGPCYYGHFVAGPDPFAPLMAYLESVSAVTPLPTVLSQGYLWQSYQQDALGLGAGISAMPSLHIAMAFLLVLACWHRGGWLRGVTLIYLVILQIGSVHLGWHYAIDGYVGILLTGAIWWLVGRFLAVGENRRTAAAAPD